MKKRLKMIIILVIAVVVLGVAVHMAAQNQVDKAVKSVVTRGIEFDPSNESFVYTRTQAEAQQELAQKLGPLGATVKVKIEEHGFFALAHWPLLGNFASGGTFADKDVATGKITYPK